MSTYIPILIYTFINPYVISVHAIHILVYFTCFILVTVILQGLIEWKIQYFNEKKIPFTFTEANVANIMPAYNQHIMVTAAHDIGMWILHIHWCPWYGEGERKEERQPIQT